MYPGEQVLGGVLRASFLVNGVALMKTFSYAEIDMQSSHCVLCMYPGEQVQGGGLRDSFLVKGVALMKTFSYAEIDMQSSH